ncbi:hypothetical protein DSO57_1038396 [Entomophthora muscae]|uniref:Uncharacterized protein n=1 Tax=Entomophthora muscae TaxID=34485 RepID=A0ACC2UKC6_9FUNG|nr:hypothetical protein DSO57_1038396 [Entomophthora muscae]
MSGYIAVTGLQATIGNMLEAQSSDVEGGGLPGVTDHKGDMVEPFIVAAVSLNTTDSCIYHSEILIFIRLPTWLYTKCHSAKSAVILRAAQAKWFAFASDASDWVDTMC